MKRFCLALFALFSCFYAGAQSDSVYLAVNGAAAAVVNFEGKGGKEQLSVVAGNGWWYIDGSIPWCEIKDQTDSSFVLVSSINSSAVPRHAYIKVRTDGAGDVRVAVVQESLPDNFLSTGSWRDSLGCDMFKAGTSFLQLAAVGEEIENCPFCSIYVGEMNGRKKEGKGYCYDRFGNLIYSGMFKKDIPVEEYPGRDDFSCYQFECQKFSNGTYYFGETRNGLRHGCGIFVSANGEAWFGRWNSGMQLVETGSTSAAFHFD